MQTGIGGAAYFIFDFKEKKVEITVQKNAELEFRLLYAPLFMRMLSLTKDIVLTGKSMHVLQKIDRPPLKEYFRDLLGLKQSTLYGGTHISDYQLELDGGITEIYVYTDIIESHFVGDTIAPLLRIIPVMSTKEDQIVINYQRPLYFPLRQNYIDCIKVELKSSSGDGIIFMSGKSLLVLSFRRRTV
ncbi:uncharacterized protein TNCV_3727901 [Trichonephila clavipes]|uniref:Uncharacterized protein n=1 Tax=Trichonephila clavipes TaxID=2585209 RepID=A0A8X6UNY2_TRICX|nr:uncharacterized protein TNCV_3727901 [Trichonephila clavipes]